MRTQPSKKAMRLVTETIEKTLPMAGVSEDDLISCFYARLSTMNPEVTETNRARKDDGVRALFSVVAGYAAGTLTPEFFDSINHIHCSIGVIFERYAIVRKHIVDTIDALVSPGDEVLDAWTEVIESLDCMFMKREFDLYAEAESKDGGWRRQRTFILAKKEIQTDDVVLLTFAPSDGEPVTRHSPGQYVSLKARPVGCEQYYVRQYTLAAPPNGIDYTIAVKKMTSGALSGYLNDDIAEGDEVTLSAPFGATDLSQIREAAPVVLLSAGIGITFVMSVLSSLCEAQRTVLSLHVTRNGKEHLFREYFRGCSQSPTSKLTHCVWYSNALPADVRGTGNDAQYHFDGHMDIGQVTDLIPLSHKDAMYFVCGPEVWRQSTAEQLAKVGVNAKAISLADWTWGSPPILSTAVHRTA
jgi:nitric oxide dioxygenase